jgi:hypothetical protein
MDACRISSDGSKRSNSGSPTDGTIAKIVVGNGTIYENGTITFKTDSSRKLGLTFQPVNIPLLETHLSRNYPKFTSRIK